MGHQTKTLSLISELGSVSSVEGSRVGKEDKERRTEKGTERERVLGETLEVTVPILK